MRSTSHTIRPRLSRLSVTAVATFALSACDPAAAPTDGGSGPADVPGLDAPGVDAPGFDAFGLDVPGLDAPLPDASPATWNWGEPTARVQVTTRLGADRKPIPARVMDWNSFGNYHN